MSTISRIRRRKKFYITNLLIYDMKTILIDSDRYKKIFFFQFEIMYLS